MPSQPTDFYKAIPRVVFNQLGITLPVMYFASDWYTYGSLTAQNHSFFKIIGNSIAQLYTSNFLTYWIHRLLHTKYLYRYHATHHEYNIPIPATTLFAHPVDHLLHNVLPYLFAYILFPVHIDLYFLYTALGTGNSILAHLDYNIVGTNKHHMTHHTRYKCNYGTGEFFDRLFGTLYEGKYIKSGNGDDRDPLYFLYKKN